ncbi:hypothetical protein ACLKA7_007390 [Drosophila subpalustris]
MKADQINRFMRVNGRKNLWLLRNTNQLYEHAVKSYYQRSNSLLPYNPKSQEAKTREENRAPVRTLTSQKERSSVPEYPRNHQQMAEQASCANSGNLLNTVMQANRRRSMSFTGSLPSYVYNSGNEMNTGNGSVSGSSNHRLSRARRRADRQATDVDEVVDVLNFGRSMSLPPRSTFELGMSCKLNRDKGPPCQKHHIKAIEKSTSAAAAALARHKNDPDRLMVVDQALKDRLAVRFDRQSDDEPISARFGLGFGSAAAGISNMANPRAPPTTSRSMNTNTTTNSISKEQTRFQTLGERIRQFEVIQFADGPVTYQAFNRRQGFGRGRGQAFAHDKHIPRQEPCLSFRNVLHTNHRQRSLNSRTSEPQLQVPQLQLQLQPQPQPEPESKAMAPEVMQLATPPLGPLKPLAPNWRPQQQQQPTMEPSSQLSTSKLSQTKIKRIKLNQSKCDSNHPNQFKVKAREKPKIIRSDQAEHGSSPNKAASCNRMSRSSHMSYIQDSQAIGKQQIPTQSSPQLPHRLGKQLKLRKPEEDLPKQPHVVKGAHHLLAASASQVSAYRRAFKNRQQILQAEMLHIHVQDQSQHIHQPKKPPMPMPSKPKIKAELKEDVKATTRQQLNQQLAASKSTNPSRILIKQERAKSLAAQAAFSKLKQKATTPTAVTEAHATNTTIATIATTPPNASSSVVLDKPSSSSRALQKLQQQQLHQQLRQRRLQPFESHWRYNY